MLIVKPSAALEWITPNALEVIERAGRTCWKSEDRIGPGSAEKFIGGTILKRQHLSVLEHASASFRFVVDRGVLGEMTRHRLASFSVESTRYCAYGKEKFGGQIKVICPPGINSDGGTLADNTWLSAVENAEASYLDLLDEGVKPEIARSVLPMCLATELVMTANFREWLHVFSLRCESPPAHPQIAEVMCQARDILAGICPVVFSGGEAK